VDSGGHRSGTDSTQPAFVALVAGENGIEVTRTGTIAVSCFGTAREGERRFQRDAGAGTSVTVTGITKPAGVWAVVG